MKSNIVRKASIDLTSQFMRMETGYSINVTGWTSIDGGRTFAHCGFGRYCRNIREAINWAREWRS